MNNDSTPNDHPSACANCGAGLEGPFCARCGQSSAEIRRPAWSLATDTIGDILVWDGRFMSTLRALFTGPGKLARAYADGQRARWTPPVRLYLLVSLAFFAAMSAAGIRVVVVDPHPSASVIRNQSEADIAVRRDRIEAELAAGSGLAASLACGVMPGPDEINADGQIVYARDSGVTVTLMRTGTAAEPRIINAETEACLLAMMTDAGIPPLIIELSITAIRDPARFEARSSAAAAQALILMVVALALINLALHPKRTMIEQLILSLYLHAAMLPGVALILLLANLAGSTPAAATVIAVVGLTGQLFLFWICDRQFYRSSWYGALLRLPLQLIGYAAGLATAATGLIILPAL